MPQTVLFLCPHGAAKSVLAAALFQRLAAERGLSLQAACAGTEPDPIIAPHVRELLSQEGLELPLERPQLVTEELLSKATRVISMGCTQDAFPSEVKHWELWDDVPSPSQNLHGAYTCIQHHLEVWAETFSAKQRDV
jgi:protein-tyrosine-phosphatase